MTLPTRPSVRAIFASILRLAHEDFSTLISNPNTFSLPPIESSDALDVCQHAGHLFNHESNLLDLAGDFFIIGDLHGHVLELIRVLGTFGMPPTSKYLFLGDLVDRGPFSVATALYIFTLKCSFPDSVYAIRGNHEFESVNDTGGLMREVVDEYESKDIFSALNVVFAQIPIAARLNKEILCVHGGIGPQLKSVNQINSIPKPLFAFSGGLADSILWSDPSRENVIFKESPRGLGYEFGERALTPFLKSNDLRLLVRGHELISEGVRTELEGKVITVFTISSYCGRTDGVAGVLQVRADQTEIPHILPWIPFISKKSQKSPPLPTKRNSGLSVAKPGHHSPMPPMVAISAMRGRRGANTVGFAKNPLP